MTGYQTPSVGRFASVVGATGASNRQHKAHSNRGRHNSAPRQRQRMQPQPYVRGRAVPVSAPKAAQEIVRPNGFGLHRSFKLRLLITIAGAGQQRNALRLAAVHNVLIAHPGNYPFSIAAADAVIDFEELTGPSIWLCEALSALTFANALTIDFINPDRADVVPLFGDAVKVETESTPV